MTAIKKFLIQSEEPVKPMDNLSFQNLAKQTIDGLNITQAQAIELLNTKESPDIMDLLCSANRIRHHFKSNKVDLCGIINAKSGRCSENCSFCSQSVHHCSKVEEYPLLSSDSIIKQAKQVAQMTAVRVGIVTSGKSIHSEKDIDTLCHALRGIKDTVEINRCASLGTLSEKALTKLKDAGLESFHHNLETAESFFPKICTTHTYQDRIKTVLAAKKVGLKVCCGGLFGLGETSKQRVELAFTLKDLDVDMIPLNFLVAHPGTPAEKNPPLQPMEILKIVAMFRFVLPEKDIRVCGGRETNLRGLQPLMYMAGANGSMVGNYLTIDGRDYKQDLQDIEDLLLTQNKHE